MNKYRKKPVVIEAIEINRENLAEITGLENVTVQANNATGSFVAFIDTLEGVMRGDEGDYIIRGVNGEFYPCKPDVFEKSYEPVGDE